MDALQRMVRIAQEGSFIVITLEKKLMPPSGASAKSKQEMADVRTETN